MASNTTPGQWNKAVLAINSGAFLGDHALILDTTVAVWIGSWNVGFLAYRLMRTRRRVPGNPFGAGVRSGDGSNASNSHLAGGGLVRFAAGAAVLKWARLGAGRSCARESYAMFERPTMGRVARIRPEAPGVHGLNLQPVLPWTLRKFRMVWPGVSLLETIPSGGDAPALGDHPFLDHLRRGSIAVQGADIPPMAGYPQI